MIKKEVKTKILLIFLGKILALIFLELLLRLMGLPEDPLVYSQPDDWSYLRSGQFSPPLNESGFREEHYSQSLFSGDKKRILFLGDSFTFGSGVDNGANRFTDLLEMQHNFENPDKLVHIYNAGIPGTEPSDWIEYLNQLLDTYEPHQVYAVFFLRDGTDICTSLWCHNDLINEIKSNYQEKKLYEYSHLARYYFNIQIIRDFNQAYINMIYRAYLGNESETSFWQQQKGSLLELQEVCQANDLDFILIIFPILYELNNKYPFEPVENEIIQFANEANIPVFSLRESFMGQRAESLWVSQNDQHPNSKGHTIAAEALYPILISNFPD
jgi:lysophospholipase L1-like esterase